MRVFIFLFLMISILSNLQAATEEIVIIKKKREVYEDSSEANRINKNNTVIANLGGQGPSFTNNTGIELGSHLDPNQLILLDLRSGKGTLNSSIDSSDGTSDTKYSSFGIHYKYFSSNSFYFRAGLDFSKYDFTMKGNSLASNEAYLNSFSGYNLNSSIAIGNQWQWENFTIGCDWIGYAKPIYYKVVNESISPSSFGLWEFSDSKQAYLKDDTGILLRLYLGSTF